MAHSKDNIEKLFKEVIELIEDGLSLRKAVLKVGISTRTFYNWIEKDEEKQQHYARATSIRADQLFEEILVYADAIDNCHYIDKNGNERVDWGKIQRNRLQMDARKWMLGKMNPKKYGDRVVNENVNKNINLDNMSDEELEAKLNSLQKVIDAAKD